MDFTEAVRYIENKNKLGQRPGLDSIKELLRRLGNPQEQVKCLHIAGTNGKGSVFAFMQDILITAGYRVGRYVSPTIFTYLERFQLNGTYIDGDTFSNVLTTVACKAEDMQRDGFLSPTAFEIETAVAFLLFYEQRVDFALIECGMGGLLDGTNVLKRPYLSVMTQISRDHMQFLGDTVEEIAVQKAGIIKEKSLCVSAPQEKRVFDVLAKTCKEKSTAFFPVEDKNIKILDMDIKGTTFTYKDEEYFISALGEYQVVNAATAIEAATHIENVTIDTIKNAIRKTRWLGRFTLVREAPYVVVDGAHNEQAWYALKKSLHKYFTNKKIIYIIGVLRDKEYGKLVDILSGTMQYAIVVTPNNDRGLENTVLAELIAKRGVNTVTAKNTETAMQYALEIACQDDVIVVCGSLSFIGDYMRDI
ncbi:MAG: bifunctional folylpolyglutamate synthase/dihydrofolate synthase [Clostridium sp.]|nr:bifunctional folylpolyglutamate synthase/dihydrofolate synthase [Clostridium sp.]MCM1400145.1 bifunctional folylpolyglutamate synthase/dihydrofolate synthase [Clostridium sp.]MCM1460832.1 bifunctional folylpolyglutamate synthase/dihydrofolate synthase [Bacteroides sp.]